MADDDFSGFSPLEEQPPVDPLMAWHQSTGLTPEEVAQHIHDPQGFAANMEARGIPPPDFHMEHDGEGNFRPLGLAGFENTSPGLTRGLGVPETQEGKPPWVASTLPPQAGEGGGPGPAIRPPPPPPAPQPSPGVPGGQVPWGGGYPSPLAPDQGAFRAGIGRETPLAPGQESPWDRPPATPPGMQPQRPDIYARIPVNGQPVGPKPEAATPPAAEPTAGKGPLDLRPSAEGIAAAQQKQKAAEEDRAKRLDDFAKMMQGIKMPQRPPPNPVGTPAAPHHTALNAPQALGLLGLLGQPGSQQTSALPNILARLLGRVG